MIKAKCIGCQKEFEIMVEGTLENFEGATMDCSYCEVTMIVKNGKLENFNEYLKKQYESMRVKTEEGKDYTKTFVEC